MCAFKRKRSRLLAGDFLDLLRCRTIDGNSVAFALPIKLAVKLEHNPCFLCRRTVGAYNKVLDTRCDLWAESESRNDGRFLIEEIQPCPLGLPKHPRFAISGSATEQLGASNEEAIRISQ